MINSEGDMWGISQDGVVEGPGPFNKKTRSWCVCGVYPLLQMLPQASQEPTRRWFIRISTLPVFPEKHIRAPEMMPRQETSRRMKTQQASHLSPGVSIAL